jgi:hypothetical protein
MRLWMWRVRGIVPRAVEREEAVHEHSQERERREREGLYIPSSASTVMCTQSKEERMGTHEGLPADGLDKAVDDLSNEFRADTRAADLGRVAVHARFPEAALVRQCWDRVRRAKVGLIL